MLLTITTTHRPATDLGHLLRKHPQKVHVFEQSYGRAQVFYPEAEEDRCTAALLLEIDPIGLVRNCRGPAGEGYALAQYVNDRPYAASSFLSVAIADVFSSALAGKAKECQELVDQPLPLEATVSVVPCRAGEQFLRRLFEPLGYQVTTRTRLLDEKFADWGSSWHYQLHLAANIPLKQLLIHLYVLIPVLDNDKHYWVGDDEVEKLIRHGEGWLAHHPEREIITRRYLKHRRDLVQDALDRLPPLVKNRLKLLHGYLIYRDKRLAGYDAATVIEVIEHLDPPRLVAFERVLFEFAKPEHVILTTPNAEYNVKWESLPAGKLRHKDHRFEWSRSQFQDWANRIAGQFGYTVRFAPVGPEEAQVGSPTQMGIFTRSC